MCMSIIDLWNSFGYVAYTCSFISMCISNSFLSDENKANTCIMYISICNHITILSQLIFNMNGLVLLYEISLNLNIYFCSITNFINHVYTPPLLTHPLFFWLWDKSMAGMPVCSALVWKQTNKKYMYCKCTNKYV